MKRDKQAEVFFPGFWLPADLADRVMSLARRRRLYKREAMERALEAWVRTEERKERRRQK